MSTVIRASIHPDKARLLKFVLPDLDFRSEDFQVFSFEGETRRGQYLTVQQDRSGFAVTTPGGLSNFLKEAGLFTDHKAEQLSSREYNDPRELMIAAAKMIVRGHSARVAESSDDIIMKALRLPLAERFEKAQAIGYERMMRIALTVLERRYDPKEQVSLRGRQKAFYAELTAAFRRDQFKQWQITGDHELDCLSLISCF